MLYNMFSNLSANIEQFQKQNVENTQSHRDSGGDTHQKSVRRQNSARRHTLSSGVDYNAVCIDIVQLAKTCWQHLNVMTALQ